ncbi:ABC transporter ATP-binding protein [uncultured Oscillibacter sp.]|uniref:ABC transporter ATP-binding protein n=1 Tax=uncultured Oscillibacter sp. TaxID=876091 RepID=UPI002804E410|nr:ABC transporter ATP-binding protein [uncultured Oscillibacter sp.]
MSSSDLLKNPIILQTENVVKQFGGLVAVDNISIELHEGEILGLIGANGAGKTTLFNMISGSFRPTSGKVLFNGIRIDKLPPNKICKLGLGRTYQIVQPFLNLTVLENTMVGALLRNSSVKEARKKAEEILEFVGLSNRKDVVGGALNIPELKRMEVARALATEPKVLLLDEVMAGLNPTESEQVIELVRNIRENGTTIVIIEHVMKAIMNLSDRIYVLNQGKLIATGTPSEITQNSEVIKSYLGEKSYAKG